MGGDGCLQLRERDIVDVVCSDGRLVVLSQTRLCGYSLSDNGVELARSL